jgi:hypothetical protein
MITVQTLTKETLRRFGSGLLKRLPSIAKGALVGTVAAILLPTGLAFYVVLRDKLLAPWYQLLRPGKTSTSWLQYFVAPAHFWPLLVVALLIVAYLVIPSTFAFFRRLYSEVVTEAGIIWAVASFIASTVTDWVWRSTALLVAIAATLRITWSKLTAENGEESRATPLVNPDRPVSHKCDDQLRRTPFVDSLADRIVLDGSPVVAVTGAYGEGKTSILNFVAEKLEQKNVLVVRFKTSLPGDDATLVSTLFNSIAKQLHTRFFVYRLRRALNRYARVLSGLVPSAPSGLKELFNAPSQQEELEELKHRLASLPVRRVAVLLDDMDRMEGDELDTLLKVIRGVEEYPKLSFICAFNKDALVEALYRPATLSHVDLQFSANGSVGLSGKARGEISSNDLRAGYEYLEKFFPVQLPVPKLDSAELAKQFDARFAAFKESYRILESPDDENTFNDTFRPLWNSHFKRSLTNIRKMNSYFNALAAAFSLVKNDVHLLDFMCLELLRETHPRIYDTVFNNGLRFYYPEFDIEHWGERTVDLGDGHAAQKKLNTEYDDLFRELHGEDRDFVLSLLGEMFRKVEAYYKGGGLSSATPSESDANKQRRIYHPSHFPTYFALQVQAGRVSASEFEEFVKQGNDRADATGYFADYLKQLQPLKRLRFLETLILSSDKLRPSAARSLVTALATISRGFEQDVLGLGDFSAAMRLTYVFANRFSASDEITDILKNAISSASSDGYASRLLYQILGGAERNTIITDWTHIDNDALKGAFQSRMKMRYHPGGQLSVYDGTALDLDALLQWMRMSQQARADVQAYLANEFERRPQSIGKHLLWLRGTLESPESRKFVDDIYPVAKLEELISKHGSLAYKTDGERQAVTLMQELLTKNPKEFRRNASLHIVPADPKSTNTSYIASVSDVRGNGGATQQAKFQSLDSLIAALKEHAGVTSTDYEQVRQTLKSGQSATVSDLWLSDEKLKALGFMLEQGAE